MRTKIIKDNSVIYGKETYMAVLPGLDGEFSVAGFHEPFLYRLRKGYIKVLPEETSRKEKLIPIADGLARFSGNTLVVVCE